MGELLCSIIAQLLLNSPISHLPFNYPSYGSKSSFPTPQSGHTQSSGMSSGHSVNVFKKTLAYEDDLLLSSHMPFLLYIFSP